MKSSTFDRGLRKKSFPEIYIIRLVLDVNFLWNLMR
jgi:hypothetical protein